MLIKFMASKETLPEASHCLQYLPLFVICWESSPWKPTMMSSKYFITTPSHWITTSSSVLRIHPSHHSTAQHMFYRHKDQLFSLSPESPSTYLQALALHQDVPSHNSQLYSVLCVNTVLSVACVMLATCFTDRLQAFSRAAQWTGQHSGEPSRAKEQTHTNLNLATPPPPLVFKFCHCCSRCLLLFSCIKTRFLDVTNS